MSSANLIDYSLEELQSEFERRGIEKYRAAQVFDWIYRKGVYDFAGMTNLPSELKSRLVSEFRVDLGEVVHRNRSGDGSTKVLLKMAGGDLVETVYIPKRDRRTICVSSQVGCKFKCAFCASGQAGFFRNLKASEIIAEVLRARDSSPDRKITNIVFMGIGEPLDNYEEVLKTIRILNDPRFFGLGARKITISTCGVVPKMKMLAAEGKQIELSVSLHGANDAARSAIMPVNKRYGVSELLAACAEYTRKTKREITFEYILAEGLNASREDAEELAVVLGEIPCKVNLIPLNPIAEFPYKRPTLKAIHAFADTLKRKGIPATVRFSSGTDINAACGQLRSVEMGKETPARPSRSLRAHQTHPSLRARQTHPSLRGREAPEAISQKDKRE